MSYENLIVEIDEKVAVVSFNRPKALNALNPPMLEELVDCLQTLEAKEDIRAVILTGAGEKAFVAGADIKAMAEFTPLDAKKFSGYGQHLMHFIEDMSKPVIAAVNGFALGGGTEIALACDFIYASEKAWFGQPEINLGVIPGFGGTQRLSRACGKARAIELCLTGDRIKAEEALRLGLVNRVVPHEELLDAAKAVARKIASKGAVSVRAAKRAVHAGFDTDLRNACRIERDAFALCFAAKDQKEGMAAFMEKREPNFTDSLE
ncbi:MAG: enoyl-CoA hydratase/isomerase family protein [Deltaproteobacteria bacterium]|nr:enoyl-CoA hydratase/isomerase family protein [Deltaproteobacteria bacterium]